MASKVTEIPAAAPADVRAHYARRLGFETDCADVFHALHAGTADFVLIDVRAPEKYAEAHVPGAVNMLVGKMIESRLSQWPPETLFVVYCAGPHCNGTDKAAYRLADMGRRVKVMIGGITGWADEGFAFARGPEPGAIVPAS